MRQLTQKIKNGKMQVIEIPLPALAPGMVLVRNFYSLISAGTEGGKVRAARKGYIGKAKEKPQQVKQVLDTLKSQGPVQTYRAVMKKLDAYSPLGYSSVGEIIDVASDVAEFKKGDIAACGGTSACHAEVVSVPINLCVKVSNPEANKINGKKHLKMTAYNTLGAIAMQGVRQADLKLGECCAVIGIGLLGQLTAVLLKASGIYVVGIDIDQVMVELGRDHCLDLALLRNAPGIENRILDFTDGIGCDGVIITAASNLLDPINFAGVISRKKGTIVVVGAVPTGFDRDPHFYKKELTVKMSCSYGPGRYDAEYEDKGRDYPIGYVRWTEKRNMQAFQELIAAGKIDIAYLTTHVFKLDNASEAYNMIVEKSEPYLGLLIEYDRKKEHKKKKVVNSKCITADSEKSRAAIGFIGAGSYAQSYLLPNILKNKDVDLQGVMTATPLSSRSVADRFGFAFCTSREQDILDSEKINAVFIATRHDSHGSFVKKALTAGKHVFVEKPLCLTLNELKEIKSLYQRYTESPQLLMVGYNRRFSPLSQIIKKKIAGSPVSMIYRINAGTVSADSWIQDVEIGGGRILGEVCHFVDYMTYISGSMPESVYAVAMDDSLSQNDTLIVSIKYENGSIGSIQYFANGSKSLPKEYIEIYCHGMTAVLKDFKELNIFGKGKSYRKKIMIQDKGQKNEVKTFINSILEGGASPIAPDEIFNTSLTTFRIIDSLRTGNKVSIL